MAHHQHRVLKLGEVIFEPGDSLKVEVIGGLVEQQVVGVAEKGLGQQHAHFLVTREVAHQHMVAVLLDAESAQQGGRVALGVPALELGETLLKL